MKNKAYLFLIFSWISFLPTRAQIQEISASNLGLVPLPLEVKAYEGKFTLPDKIVIATRTPTNKT